MCGSRVSSDISIEMSAHQVSLADRRLRPHLLETRVGLAIALLITVVLVLAVGLKARAALDCTARSIGAHAALCSSQVPAPADAEVRLVFATDAVAGPSAR